MSERYLQIRGTQAEGVVLSVVGKERAIWGVDYGGSGLFWCSIPISSIKRLISGKTKRIKAKS